MAVEVTTLLRVESREGTIPLTARPGAAPSIGPLVEVGKTALPGSPPRVGPPPAPAQPASASAPSATPKPQDTK